MRQFTLLTTIAIVALFQATVSHSEDGGDGSNWGKITEVYVDANVSVVRLQFSRPIVNPSNCEGADYYVRELDDSAASDRFLSIVLAAHLANRKVKFWIDGCTKSQWWGKTRPLIYDIYIGN